MAYTDANRSPQERDRRERQLTAMREKWKRDPPRSPKKVFLEKQMVTVKRVIKAHNWTPGEIAHAIRIAIKEAQQHREPNPAFIEALEIAASYFDDL